MDMNLIPEEYRVDSHPQYSKFTKRCVDFVERFIWFAIFSFFVHALFSLAIYIDKWLGQGL